LVDDFLPPFVISVWVQKKKNSADLASTAVSADFGRGDHPSVKLASTTVVGLGANPQMTTARKRTAADLASTAVSTDFVRGDHPLVKLAPTTVVGSVALP